MANGRVGDLSKLFLKGRTYETRGRRLPWRKCTLFIVNNRTAKHVWHCMPFFAVCVLPILKRKPILDIQLKPTNKAYMVTIKRSF